jgi:hypothetical protein
LKLNKDWLFLFYTVTVDLRSIIMRVFLFSGPIRLHRNSQNRILFLRDNIIHNKVGEKEISDEKLNPYTENVQ